MSEAINSAFHDFVLMLTGAVKGADPWLAVLALVVCVGIVAAIKGKLTSSFVWIPGLAVAAYYAIYRWLKLQ